MVHVACLLHWSIVSFLRLSLRTSMQLTRRARCQRMLWQYKSHSSGDSHSPAVIYTSWLLWNRRPPKWLMGFAKPFRPVAPPAYPPVLYRPDRYSHRHGCAVDFLRWPRGEFRRAEHVTCTVALSRDVLLRGTKFQWPLTDWSLPHLLHVIWNYSATVNDCGFCRWPW